MSEIASVAVLIAIALSGLWWLSHICKQKVFQPSSAELILALRLRMASHAWKEATCNECGRKHWGKQAICYNCRRAREQGEFMRNTGGAGLCVRGCGRKRERDEMCGRCAKQMEQVKRIEARRPTAEEPSMDPWSRHGGGMAGWD